MKAFDRWFIDHVLVHERVLTALLARTLELRADVEDARQEVYARAYAAARSALPEHPRAFLLGIARNYLIDRFRRERTIGFTTMADFDALFVFSDEPSPEDHAVSRQSLRHLLSGLAALPPRCREVVTLRKIDGLSQREVARRLGISEATVEKQVAKGVRRLADAVYGPDLSPANDDEKGSPRDRAR